jgi:hypothetical protein
MGKESSPNLNRKEWAAKVFRVHVSDSSKAFFVQASDATLLTDSRSYKSRSCFPCPNTDVYDSDDTQKTDVLTVAACDHLGTPLPTANRDAAFHLFGDRMAVKSLGAVDEVSGSSVATAVATGIAAISLGLSRYARTEDERAPALIIRKTFNKMKTDDTKSKFVNPESYFTPGPSVNASEPASAWKDTSMVNWAKTAI